MIDIHNHRILILDFGSQTSQLIARRIREIGVYCEIMPFNVNPHWIQSFLPNGIILTGGPESVNATGAPQAPSIVFEMGCPVLGICYGMQTMVTQLGGRVARAKHSEFGLAYLELKEHSSLLHNITDQEAKSGARLLEVWMSHGDQVTCLPDGFQSIAQTTNAIYAAVADPKRRFFGVQFHPEVSHTKQGKRILQRFVMDICGCQINWTSTSIIQDILRQIEEIVADDGVVLGLSGGVDSAVVAALLQRAIHKKVHCVFIDNGLLRQGEAEQVVATFRDYMGMDVIKVDASEQFIAALKGMTDPETKRKTIGRIFVEVFEQYAGQFKQVKFLAQGTIYPDVIESAASATGKAHVIKSHHNVGGLPEKMNLKVIEPLRELFKDEVRRIGLELGLPSELINRHPFPGPGLAVRCLAEVTRENLEKLRQADYIFISELHAHDFYQRVSQAFAVLLPVNTVAVKGDARCYSSVIALRSVDSIDFMTADMSALPLDFLQRVANRISNEVPGVSRVVYDLSSKPPATIEWE